MKALLYLFTSPTCPHCPAAKESVEAVKQDREDVEVKIFSIATEEGRKMAEQLHVTTVPTTLIKGVHKDIIGIKGSRSKERLNEYIDMSLDHRKPL